jgi:hypothetical protein
MSGEAQELAQVLHKLPAFFIRLDPATRTVELSISFPRAALTRILSTRARWTIVTACPSSFSLNLFRVQPSPRRVVISPQPIKFAIFAMKTAIVTLSCERVVRQRRKGFQMAAGRRRPRQARTDASASDRYLAWRTSSVGHYGVTRTVNAWGFSQPRRIWPRASRIRHLTAGPRNLLFSCKPDS